MKTKTIKETTRYSIWELEGSVKIIIEFLQRILDKANDSCRMLLDLDEYLVEFVWERPETAEEKQKRLEMERKENERKLKQEQRRKKLEEEKERKLYKELKKKFEAEDKTKNRGGTE